MLRPPCAQGHVNKEFCLFSTFCTTAFPGCQWMVVGSEDHSICVFDVNRQQVGGLCRALRMLSSETCCTQLHTCTFALLRGCGVFAMRACARPRPSPHALHACAAARAPVVVPHEPVLEPGVGGDGRSTCLRRPHPATSQLAFTRIVCCPLKCC